MFAIWYLGSEIYSFNLLQNAHVRISFYRNRKPFCVNPQVIIEILFPNNRQKIVDSNAKLRKRSGLSFCSSFNDNWECFLFWNENFYLQIKKYKEKLTVVYITENDSTVCYFNKARYLFGMNNQLALPRTERLFYFKITSSQWIGKQVMSLSTLGECKTGPCSGIRLLFVQMSLMSS